MRFVKYSERFIYFVVLRNLILGHTLHICASCIQYLYGHLCKFIPLFIPITHIYTRHDMDVYVYNLPTHPTYVSTRRARTYIHTHTSSSHAHFNHPCVLLIQVARIPMTWLRTGNNSRSASVRTRYCADTRELPPHGHPPPPSQTHEDYKPHGAARLEEAIGAMGQNSPRYGIAVGGTNSAACQRANMGYQRGNYHSQHVQPAIMGCQGEELH